MVRLTEKILTSLGYNCKLYGKCTDYICGSAVGVDKICEIIDCLRGDFTVVDDNNMGMESIKNFVAVMNCHQ